VGQTKNHPCIIRTHLFNVRLMEQAASTACVCNGSTHCYHHSNWRRHSVHMTQHNTLTPAQQWRCCTNTKLTCTSFSTTPDLLTEANSMPFSRTHAQGKQSLKAQQGRHPLATACATVPQMLDVLHVAYKPKTHASHHRQLSKYFQPLKDIHHSVQQGDVHVILPHTMHFWCSEQTVLHLSCTQKQQPSSNLQALN